MEIGPVRSHHSLSLPRHYPLCAFPTSDYRGLCATPCPSSLYNARTDHSLSILPRSTIPVGLACLMVENGRSGVERLGYRVGLPGGMQGMAEQDALSELPPGSHNVETLGNRPRGDTFSAGQERACRTCVIRKA
jgi:hypothetical protein